MRRNLRRVTFWLAVASLLVMATVTIGCSKPTPPKTTAKPPVVATETVVPTETGVATEPVAVEPAAPAEPAAPTAPVGPWPAKVGTFATKFKGAVWYPTKLPSGMKTDSLDVLEFEPGSGLVCDIFFVSPKSEVSFLQGSPKTREYEIVSVGKVPWGAESADVVYEDPEDKTSPQMIVYNAKGTLAELSGGATFNELKAIAASMVLVK